MLDIIPTHRYRFPITRCPVCAKSHALLSYGHSGPILTAFYSNLPTRDGFIHALANTVAVYKYQCSQHRSVTYVVVSLIRKINPAKKIVFFCKRRISCHGESQVGWWSNFGSSIKTEMASINMTQHDIKSLICKSQTKQRRDTV